MNKKPEKMARPESDEIFAELDEQQAGHGHGGCVALIIYFALIYLVFVLALWQLGTITHQTNRDLSDLYQARSLTEVRDALAETFSEPEGWQLPSIEDLRRSATDSVNDAVQEKIEEQTSNITDQITDQITNQAESAVEGFTIEPE